MQAAPGPQGVPVAPQIPDVWPIVPVIATNKNPVFPKFIKIIEVTEPKLVELLRQKVRLNQPYAGVFVKKDDNNQSEFVTDVNELYPIGSFVQIVEMQDLGHRLRMVVMAHRRISLQDRVIDSEAQEKANEDESKKEDDPVIMVTTENYEHEPYETTDEIKALTQEIIKTIRDIIVSTSFYKVFNQDLSVQFESVGIIGSIFISGKQFYSHFHILIIFKTQDIIA